MSSIGPAAAVRVCTWRGSRGISDGSGSSANPWASTEVSNEGRSLNENKTASRAPAASITAVSMVRAVWRKSRSAVSSGPKSASASTVLKSFFRLAPCNASCGGTCEKPERNQVSTARRLDCWLVWCGKTSGDLTIGSSHHLSLLELPITRWSDRQITQCHNALVSLDRCVALAHTSAKSPAPLAFCRFCPATYRPREIRGSASIQSVALRENTSRC